MMTRQTAGATPTAARLRATVSVDGRRWRRLGSAAALAAATPDARVFILDPESGGVRFGDGAHGARPPRGSRVRVSYRHGAGADAVAVTWTAEWPPRPGALAAAWVPRSLTEHCT